jgi:hypothetical protein
MRVWIVLYIAAMALGQDHAPADTGIIQGQVFDSVTRIGISKARVMRLCWITPTVCPAEMSLTAQPDGRFEIDGVPPGSYGLIADAHGFLETGAVATAEVKANSVTTVEVSLDPEARIEGTVVNENRKPISQVEVAALQPRYGALTEVAKSTTSKSGEYSLAGLAQGTYYVRVRTTKDSIYYPSSFDLESAAPIHLDPGQTAMALKVIARQRPMYRLAGKITWGASPPSDKTLSISLVTAGRQTIAKAAPARSDNTLTFEFRVVASGHYKLQLVGSTFSKSLSDPSISVGSSHLLTRDTVDLGSKDIDDLVMRIPDPINVVGKLVWDETPQDAAVPTLKIALSGIREDRLLGPPKQAQAQKDGSFTIADCDPLRYTVRLGSHPGSYIQSITANGQDATATYLDLSSASPTELVIKLHGGGGSLSGTVTMPENAAKMLATLIPSGADADSSLELPMTTVKEDGKFTFANLRPGTYHAVAMPDGRIPWEDSGVLRAIAMRGQLITIGDGGNDDLQLEPVPASEISTLIDRARSN